MEMYFTERLILKQLNEDNAEQVLNYYLRNKNFLAEWEAKREENFYSLNTHKELLKKDIESYKLRNSIKYWIFKKGDESKVIGCVSFQNIVRSIIQSCILGYKMDLSEVGNGFITEALEKAINIIFSKYRLHRIEAPIMPKNTASIRVVKKLGFRDEGITKKMIKVNGVWEDHIRWSLLNPNV